MTEFSHYESLSKKKKGTLWYSVIHLVNENTFQTLTCFCSKVITRALLS